jgi:hypothetical protein
MTLPWTISNASLLFGARDRRFAGVQNNAGEGGLDQDAEPGRLSFWFLLSAGSRIDANGRRSGLCASRHRWPQSGLSTPAL